MKSESRIQQEIFVWYNNSFCRKDQPDRQIIFHVANEGQHRLASIGVLSGVSDIICTVSGVWTFIEVKTLTGRLSQSQKDFQRRIEDLGYDYAVVRSLEEFKLLIVKE